MTVVLGPGRDKELGVSPEIMEKRSKKIKEALSKPIAEIAMYLAEGQTMMYGPEFESGADLAIFLSDAITFSIATLQENGKLHKTLPKQKKPKEESHGQYL